MNESEGKKLDGLVNDYKTGKISLDDFTLAVWNLAYQAGEKDSREAVIHKKNTYR